MAIQANKVKIKDAGIVNMGKNPTIVINQNDAECGEDVKQDVKIIKRDVKIINQKLEQQDVKLEKQSDRMEKIGEQLKGPESKRTKKFQLGNHMETTKQSNMIESTKAMVDKQSTKSKFIETAAFRRAKGKLSTNGVVVIKGNTGDGKTRLAIQLLSWLMRQDNAKSPIELHDLSDWNDTVSPNQSLAVFIDDIFHDNAFRQVNMSIWQSKEKNLSSTFFTGDDSNVLIVTVRNDDFSSLDLNVLEFFQVANVIDLSTTDAISEQDKLDLLELYKPQAQNFEPFSIKEKKEIVKYAPLLGFPQCCVLYRDLSISQPERVNFFRNPYVFMETALLKLESGRCAALLFLFLCGGEVLERDLDPNNDEIDKTILDEVFDINLVKGKSIEQLSHKQKIKFLQESLDHLSSSLVTKNKLWWEPDAVYYHFSHASVKDIVALLYAKNTPMGFIQNCPCNSLYYITTCKDSTNKRVIISDRKHLYLMYERLLRELKSKCTKNYRIIASLDILNEDEFDWEFFFRWLANKENAQDLHLTWTTENDVNMPCLCDWNSESNEFHDRNCRVSFLVYVAYSDNYSLLKKLVDRTPNNHPQLQYALYSMIMAGKFSRCFFQETFALLQSKINRRVFIQNCPLDCLHYITTSVNVINKLFIAHDNVDMYKRLQRELDRKKSKIYTFIAGLGIWKDNSFVLGFLEWLVDVGIDKDFHLNCTTDGVERDRLNFHTDYWYWRVIDKDNIKSSFLVYVAHTDNLFLLEKLVERTPIDHVQLQRALFTVIAANPFHNSFVKKRFASLYGRVTQRVFIQNCPYHLLHYITTSKSLTMKLAIAPDDVDMYKRLLRELETKHFENYREIADLGIWRDNQFVVGFLSWLDDEGTAIDFHLNWTTDIEISTLYFGNCHRYRDDKNSIQPVSFLFHVARSDNLFLLEKLVERTPEDHPQLQSALFTLITSRCFNVQSYTSDRVKAELLLGRITPICFIQNCPCCSLDFITTSTNIRYKKTIAPDNVEMYKRLLRELKSKRSENYRYIAGLDIWKDKEFILGFLSWLDERTNTAFHINLTTEDVQIGMLYRENDHVSVGVLAQSPSFLVYVAHTDNLFLLNKLVERTPENHVQLQNALFTVIGRGQSSDKPVQDRISNLLRKITESVFIQNCPLDCLHYITTSENVINKLFVAHDNVDLYKRLQRELERKKSKIYRFIAQLDIWKNKRFVLGFLGWLDDEGNDKGFHLDWTTKDFEKDTLCSGITYRYFYVGDRVYIKSSFLCNQMDRSYQFNMGAENSFIEPNYSLSFLVHVAHSDNLFLLEKLVERTPEDHPQLQSALFTLITSLCFNVQSYTSDRVKAELLLGRITPICFIQNCPCCSLDFITTSTNIRYKKTIASDNLEMYKRLLRELKSKHPANYGYIAELDIWNDKEFVLGFLSWLDDEGIARDFHLNWTTEDDEGCMLYSNNACGNDRIDIQSPSFLVYVANTNNLVLLDKLVERTPENHVQLQYALFSMIGRGQSYVEFSEDRVSLLLFKIKETVFKLSSDHCVMSTELINTYFVEHDDVDMSKGVLKGLKFHCSEVYKRIAEFEIWKDNRFVLGFLGWLEDKTIYKDHHHLNWTTESVEKKHNQISHVKNFGDWHGNNRIHIYPCLPLVTYTDNIRLLEKLLGRTTEDHPQFPSLLLRVITSLFFDKNVQSNTSPRDKAELLFQKITPIWFIQNCPCKSLNFITTSKTKSYKNAIAPCNVDLYKRLLSELKSKNSIIYICITRLEIWKDNQVVLGFLGWLDDEEIDKDFHLNWTTEDVEKKTLYPYNGTRSWNESESIRSPSFLVYVAHTDNIFLLNKIVERTPQNHVQLQRALFSIIESGQHSHSSFQERFSILVSKITKCAFIRNCPCDCLHYITTSESLINELVVAHDDEDVYKRFLRELQSKSRQIYKYMVSLDIWKDNRFVLGFLGWLENEGIDKDFHLNWTTEDIERYNQISHIKDAWDLGFESVHIQSPSLLVYVAHTDNLFLLGKLVERTPQNHVQLQRALFNVTEKGQSSDKSVQGRISHLLRKITKSVFIQKCPYDYLSYITTSENLINKLVVKYDDEDMYKRFLIELESKRSEVYKYIAGLDIWKDERFVLGFLGWLEDEDIDKDFHLHWTTEDVEKFNQISHVNDSLDRRGDVLVHIQPPSFLVYVSHTDNLLLLEKLVEKTPKDHPQLQSALFTVIISPYFNSQGSSTSHRDRAKVLLERITPICFIQNCPCCSLNFITTSPNIRYKKRIAPDNVDMYKRLLRELESKRSENHQYIAELDIWKDNECVLGFIRWIDDEGIHKDFHLKWTTDFQWKTSYHFYMERENPFIGPENSLSFLVYVAHSDNLSFLHKLLERTPKDHAQLQLVMFGVVRAGHIEVLNKLIDWGTTPTCLAVSSDKFIRNEYNDSVEKINVLIEACLYERKEMVERLATNYPFLVHDIRRFEGFLLYIAAKTGNCSLYKTVEDVVFPDLSREERAQRLCEMADDHKLSWTVLHTTLYKADSKDSLTLYLLRNYPELASARDNKGWHCLHHMSWTSSKDLFIKAHSHFQNYYKDFDITTIVTNEGESVLDVAKESENVFEEEIFEYLSQFWPQTSNTPKPESD